MRETELLGYIDSSYVYVGRRTRCKGPPRGRKRRVRFFSPKNQDNRGTISLNETHDYQCPLSGESSNVYAVPATYDRYLDRREDSKIIFRRRETLDVV